jgi:hypothetical protein
MTDPLQLAILAAVLIAFVFVGCLPTRTGRAIKGRGRPAQATITAAEIPPNSRRKLGIGEGRLYLRIRWPTAVAPAPSLPNRKCPGPCGHGYGSMAPTR